MCPDFLTAVRPLCNSDLKLNEVWCKNENITVISRPPFDIGLFSTRRLYLADMAQGTLLSGMLREEEQVFDYIHR